MELGEQHPPDVTRFLNAALLLICALFVQAGGAQEDGDTRADSLVFISLTDGTLVEGTIIEETETHVLVETPAGLEVRVPRASIAAREERRPGTSSPPDSNYTHRMFAPAGRSLRVDGLNVPESGYMQVVETKDGGMHIGRIVAIGVNSVQIETNHGKVEIPIQAIEKVRRVPESSMQNGKYWYPDLNTTRLFITTTAQMMERGQGYYSNRYLFFSMLAYGVTDNFSIGVGGLTLPVDIEDIPFYVTPKLGLLNQESLDLALGALIMRVPGGDDDDDGFSTGILYGVGTFGGPEGLTAGLGWGFVEDEISNRPVIVLGGKRRWTRRLSVVVESWHFPHYYGEPFVIYGIRFLGLRMTVDVGMVGFPSEGIVFPGWPYFDFVFNFGH